jgi:hypothetical protein
MDLSPPEEEKNGGCHAYARVSMFRYGRAHGYASVAMAPGALYGLGKFLVRFVMSSGLGPEGRCAAGRSRDIWLRMLRSSICAANPRPERFFVRPANFGASAGHGSFAARSLHSGLRPPVEMTGEGLRPPVEMTGEGLRPPVEMTREGLRPPVAMTGEGLRPPVEMTMRAHELILIRIRSC